ncbi:MAG: hypothetical protein ACK4ZW_08365 [Blastomonas sp.]
MATAAIVEQTPPHLEILASVDVDPACVLQGRYTADQLVEAIRADIADREHDIATKAGRDRIASEAFTIRKRKAAIDRTRKDMTEAWRKQTNEVNAAGKAITEKLDALAEEVRAPVTAWEDAEAARKAEADKIIDDLSAAAVVSFSEATTDIEARLDRIRGINLNGEVLGVRLDMAQDMQRKAIVALTDVIEQKRAQEAQARELEQLRREREEAQRRAEQEAAERLAKERAEAAAKAEADRIAKAAQEAADRARREAEEAAAHAEREREAQARAAAEAAERKRQERESAARAAEEERARQAQAAIDAANRRAEEAERAAQAERDRIAQAERAEVARLAAEAEALRNREADQAHRQQVIQTAADSLTGIPGLTQKLAKSIIYEIAAGNVPAVSIAF